MAEHEVEEREERLLSSEEGDDEEAVPSTVRIAKLLEQGRTKEIRTAFSALQSEVKAAQAELKLAEQTAGIATRDHNELWESFQQLRQELSEAQARLVERAEELAQAKEQLRQQKDETAAAGTRVDSLRGELAVSVEELQQLQEQVKVLSGFLDIVGQAAGETGSRMDKFKRQRTGNRQPQQASGGAGGNGAGSSGAASSGAGGSSSGGSGAAGQRGNASQPGWAPRRSKEHFAYLQTKKMCARCFSSNKHDYKACKAPIQPANAVPPGFDESG
jgi:exonuclease VII large subunit